MKKKPIYGVYCTTQFGFGLQGVKALNQKEARRKFKRRFPKQKIIDCWRIDEPWHSIEMHAI
jgi:hypothetical protein